MNKIKITSTWTKNLDQWFLSVVLLLLKIWDEFWKMEEGEGVNNMGTLKKLSKNVNFVSPPSSLPRMSGSAKESLCIFKIGRNNWFRYNMKCIGDRCIGVTSKVDIFWLNILIFVSRRYHWLIQLLHLYIFKWMQCAGKKDAILRIFDCMSRHV